MASGSYKAQRVTHEALCHPLLGALPTKTAEGCLVTILGASDLTLIEVDHIMDNIGRNLSPQANIIFGTCFDESLQGSLRLSLIVCGM